MMNAADTQTASSTAPIDVLRDALPALGYRVSLDLDDIYRRMWERAYRRAGKTPTRGQVRAIITAWIADTAAKLAAHEAEQDRIRGERTGR